MNNYFINQYFFFEGTSMIVVHKGVPNAKVLIFQLAHNMISNHLSSISKEEQIEIYKAQLNEFKQAFEDEAVGGPLTEEIIKKVSLKLLSDENKLKIKWCLNVCALIILNAIEDDENNGYLEITHN
jgi:hypothetical protein